MAIGYPHEPTGRRAGRRTAAGVAMTSTLLAEARRDAHLVAVVLLTAIGTALVVLAHSLS
ncbi:hypothetical protein C8P69_11125 [Phreatobacter oligotrophus]|jgi:hypothetical protein|uniref:Uncharacterized protein n=1 Tax=Phreatobacter oligotrophus TaxID=1122261 RepID=A0A2T4YXN0_9HYPH|nr:hypothetical protein C8P69_11125 [Phreatobacter oligotrophus]